MWKNVLAICGIILFLGGLVLICFLIIGARKATTLDNAPIPGFGQCPDVQLGAHISNYVMSESDTQALAVVVTNYCSGREAVSVSMNAPEFDFSPSESMRTFTVVGSTRFDWILIPRRLGTFALTVSLDGGDTFTFGITVVNVFGLRLWQTQLLSYVATFFGPVFTFVWWYGKWKERKRRKSEEAGSASVTAKTSQAKPTVSSKPNKRVRRRS